MDKSQPFCKGWLFHFRKAIVVGPIYECMKEMIKHGSGSKVVAQEIKFDF